MSIEIATSLPELTLVQLRPEDGRPLFELIDRNRPHLSQHEDDTSARYPDHESVLRSITDPEKNKLRFGVWSGTTLVGVAYLKLSGDTVAELGYWIGSEFTRRGYATAAGTSLRLWAETERGYINLVAFSHRNNTTSHRVLARCGFRFSCVWPGTKNAFLFRWRKAA